MHLKFCSKQLEGGFDDGVAAPMLYTCWHIQHGLLIHFLGISSAWSHELGPCSYTLCQTPALPTQLPHQENLLR